MKQRLRNNRYAIKQERANRRLSRIQNWFFLCANCLCCRCSPIELKPKWWSTRMEWMILSPISNTEKYILYVIVLTICAYASIWTYLYYTLPAIITKCASVLTERMCMEQLITSSSTLNGSVNVLRSFFFFFFFFCSAIYLHNHSLSVSHIQAQTYALNLCLDQSSVAAAVAFVVVVEIE